jgi:hypothetical protein
MPSAVAFVVTSFLGRFKLAACGREESIASSKGSIKGTAASLRMGRVAGMFCCARGILDDDDDDGGVSSMRGAFS